MRRISRIAAVLAAFIAPSFAQAQNWPTRTLRIVVPFQAGGSGDVSVRLVADRLAPLLGQSVVVDNRTGAAGNIGNESVARSSPDGYTLVMLSDAAMLGPHVYSKLGYDPIKDFVPVIQLAKQPVLLAAHPSIGASTLDEVTALSVRQGGLSYATSGAGTQQHLLGELYAKRAGAKLIHVPYRGGGQAINDLVGGQIPLGVLGSAPLLPHYRSGAIRLIAQSSATRSASLPDIPTFEQAGIAGIAIDQWLGIAAPTGTPPAIIARLNAEIAKALSDPALRERYAALALEPVGGSAEQFARRMKEDHDRYGALSRELNMPKVD
jgi:tripartite-type tricarboxylate transporter receptor subunit TctC